MSLSCNSLLVRVSVLCTPTCNFIAGTGSSFTRQIDKSDSDTVCVLVRVTPRTNDANMNNIQRSSSNEDYYIVPVARSYNNNNWERVAGPYAQDLSVSGCCNVAIPNLSNEGKLVLMSFSHSVTNKEEVSRFFQQTTFGPNLDMINSWNYNNDLMQEMGKWLETQMDTNQISMTSHRAFFRERADFPAILATADRYVRPRHPCRRFSRWREHSFVTADYGYDFGVTRWNGQYLITVDGYPRTVMSTWKDESTGQNLRLGTWRFCWYTNEVLGGEVSIYDQDSDECYTIFNPKVNLPDAALSSQIRKVTLPNKSNFGTIDPIYAQNHGDIMFGSDLYAKSGFTTTGCSDITDDGAYRNVLGTFPDGSQVWYAGQVQLDENSLENPISDGGRAMLQVNLSSAEEWASKPKCPVPNPNFVNSKY